MARRRHKITYHVGHTLDAPIFYDPKRRRWFDRSRERPEVASGMARAYKFANAISMAVAIDNLSQGKGGPADIYIIRAYYKHGKLLHQVIFLRRPSLGPRAWGQPPQFGYALGQTPQPTSRLSAIPPAYIGTMTILDPPRPIEEERK